MKTKLMSMLVLVVATIFFSSCYAQSYGYYDNDNDYNGYNSGSYSNQNVTVEAGNSDISYNLDLRAVANVFADSRNLEEFEQRINDYDSRINNLDLNGDGQVDYLRVIERGRGNSHLVVLQAVLGPDTFQDVASIIVERRNNRRNYVQIIGDPYIYGPYYIIEPVYVYTPSIFSFFWGPYYHSWYSPYYWGYYPSYWHYWNPYPVGVYVNNINIYVNKYNNRYNYTDRISSNNYNELRRGISRNDYQRANPERSFSNRNSSRANVTNRKDLGNYRGPDRITSGSRSKSDVRGNNGISQRGNSTMDARTNSRNSIGSNNSSRSYDQMNRGRGIGAVRGGTYNTQRSSSSNNSTQMNQGTRARGYEQGNTRMNSGRNTDNTTVTPRSINSNRGNVYSQPSRSTSRDDVYSQPGRSGSYSTPSRSSGNGSYSVPSRASRDNVYSQPNRNSNSGTYSAPSRSSNSGSYSAPSRASRDNVYSQPSRNGNSGTYSAPSRSSNSGSYSAPSRSSGGSYSAPDNSNRSYGGRGSRR
ncbi:MAG: hypothetical protein ACYC2P_05045 [Paludibacteraceae bacterium]